MKPKLIPNINEKITQVLSSQKLTPEISFRDSPVRWGRTYWTPCQKNNKKVFLKIRISDSSEVAETLIREYRILKELSESSLSVPSLLGGRIDREPEWFLVEYLGDKIVGLLYDFYLPDKLLPKVARLLVGNLRHLHKIRASVFFKKIGVEKPVINDGSWYLSQVTKRLEKISSYLKEPKKIENFFKENRQMIDKNTNFLAHGDFSLASIMYFKSKIYLVDWEYLHLDNFCRDIAHLWVQGWKKPRFRQILLNQFQKTHGEDQPSKLLSAMLLFESLGNLSWWHIEHKVRKSEFFKFHTKEALRVRLEDIENLMSAL